MEKTALRYDPAAHFEIETRDVAYRNDGSRDWLATVYRPKGEGPFPTLMDVHGGAWNDNDRTQNVSYLRKLAASGLLLVAIDFRSAPDGAYPAALEDINFATRWLKVHAAEFGGAAAPLGIIGSSSGGHLALLSTMRPRDPRYMRHEMAEHPELDGSADYVIVCSAVIDPLARYELVAKANNDTGLMGRHMRFYGDEATMIEANPQRMLERGEEVTLPVGLWVQGAVDPGLPEMFAENFAAAYARAGGIFEVGKYATVGHSFIREETVHTDRALAQIRGFIQRQVSA